MNDGDSGDGDGGNGGSDGVERGSSTMMDELRKQQAMLTMHQVMNFLANCADVSHAILTFEDMKPLLHIEHFTPEELKTFQVALCEAMQIGMSMLPKAVANFKKVTGSTASVHDEIQGATQNLPEGKQ